MFHIWNDQGRWWMSSVKRAIEVLDLLARKGALGVRAVATHLDLPVGSVHRLLQDLDDENVVERNEDGNWRLSYRLLQITELQLDNIQLPRLARPFCETIAEATRETVNVNVLSGANCICVDKVRGNEGMQLDFRIGTRSPLHCGGSAKAILAFQPDATIDKVVSEPLTGFTSRTITAPDELKAELARIRRRGYSIDDEELVMGIWCVGMPIVDRTGRAVGAISITGPSHKSVGPEVQPLVDLLANACNQVSRSLGYSGSWPPMRPDGP